MLNFEYSIFLTRETIFLSTFSHTASKLGRVLLWILVSLVALVLLIFLFVNLPVGKRTVKNQLVSYLEKKLKTNVTVGDIDFSLPKWVKLKNIYVEDQNKDTLFYGEELSVDLDMLKLIYGNTDIKKVYAKNLVAHIERPSTDTVFNFQFLIDAFTGNKKEVVNKDTAELKISLNALQLDQVRFRMRDAYAGSNMNAFINKATVTSRTFQPDRLKFFIEDFNVDGLNFTLDNYKGTLVPDTLALTDTSQAQEYGLFLSADHFSLKNALVRVDDSLSGLHYDNNVNHLRLSSVLFNLNQSTATADSIYLDSSSIAFQSPQKKPVVITANDTSTVAPWFFKFNSLLINNSAVKYDDVNLAATGGLDFGHLNISALNSDISNFFYSADTTRALVNQFSFKDKSSFVLDTAHANFLMTGKTLAASAVYIRTPYSRIENETSLTYDSLSGITLYPQNTTLNTTLTKSRIAFSDLYLLAPILKTSLPPQKFSNQFLDINTKLQGSLGRVVIPYMQLVGLTGSRLNAKGVLYNLTDAKRFRYDLQIFNSLINKTDLLKFIPPEQALKFADFPPTLALAGTLTGDANNLIADIKAVGNQFNFDGVVTLNNIQNPEALAYGADFRSLSLSRQFISGFIPPEALANINLPEQIIAKGKVSGNTNNVLLDANLLTSYGNAYVKGFFNNIQDPPRTQYDLLVRTNQFHVGKLIKQDTVLGRLTGEFIAKGTGFEPASMRANLLAAIDGFEYNKYNYQNIDATVDANRGTVKAKGNIGDPNLAASFDVVTNTAGAYPTLQGIIQLDTVQLMPLGFSDTTFNLSGLIDIDARSLKPRQLDASLFVDGLRMQYGDSRYLLDTISLLASSAGGIDSVILDAPFAEIRAGGAFDYDQVGPSILNYISNKYSLPGLPKPLSNNLLRPQQFGATGYIAQNPIILGFVPGLQNFEPINFSAKYTSSQTDSTLSLTVDAPRTIYNNMVVSKAAIGFSGSDNKINYNIVFDTFNTGSKIFYTSFVRGNVAGDSVTLNARTSDAANRAWYGLAGTANVHDSAYSFTLQDTLLLNYEAWNVRPNNYISYNNRGWIVNNFGISNDSSVISANSQSLQRNSPIDFNIKDFDLATIAKFANADTLIASGVLNVQAVISDLNKKLPGFTGNASLTKLQLYQNDVGDVSLTAQKLSDNEIAATLNLTGFGNDIKANANYYLNNSNNQFDATLNVNALTLKTIEAFSAGQLINGGGKISGQMKANGMFTDPRWNGLLRFDTAKFTIAQLGTPYYIDGQTIDFKYPRINFPAFTIKDSLNHSLITTGYVSVPAIDKVTMDLDINARDFVLVNAKKAINSQIYGYAAVDIDARVTGTGESPNIEGDVFVNDKSDLTLLLPPSNYTKDEGTSLVRFIDRDTFDVNPPIIPFSPAKEPAAEFAKYLNYNLGIQVNKEAIFTIVLDPLTGDEVKVQGDARLTAGVDPAGNLVLAGTYDLYKGYYNFNYQFVSRKFYLSSGSIVFAGDPLNAVADITATYTANTSAGPLVNNAVTNPDASLTNALRQKLPFDVVLNIDGPLAKPKISFDIQLPEEGANVNTTARGTIESRLSQIRDDEAAMNKQVFSLLLFNRFISEQSSDFFAGNGDGNALNTLARQSVSQFLGDALNEIAGDLIKGVNIDLSLEAYDDYSTGNPTQKTDLNIALSKSFLNDRLLVSVGSSLGVQGGSTATKAQGNQSGFTPDLSLAYKLTPDGKYLLRAYTKNQYEAVVDGFVMETGLSFVVVMDYDKFKELFQRQKRRR